MTDEKAESPDPGDDVENSDPRPEAEGPDLDQDAEGSDTGPAPGPPGPEEEPEALPLGDISREFGPYRILRVLGRGGMGIVYLAEQTSPIRRRVALKVLKAGLDTEQVIARFESERQALAVMDHPNIAKVFDGGMTPEGRPYFAMEAVYGIPITRYANNHRLSVPQRLRLFLSVCSAVQHAHLKGVIHRDLKPSNVLVVSGESTPVVKVIDFGLAKAVGVGLSEHSVVTQHGQQLGTPDYMSPEQGSVSGLDVDSRTDIYSLGVILYELLVGCRPLVLLTRPGEDLARALEETEVPRPSVRVRSLGDDADSVAHDRGATADSLRSQLRGDLDWIILKAMEKDRRRRYETAGALAMDIMRYLDDEPVLARPPSPTYRLGKFVRRNRAGVVAATVALVAILAGGTAATAGLIHALAERERAEQAAATAQQAAAFLADLFEASDPAAAGGTTLTARDLLDRGAARIPTEFAEQPAVQAMLLRTIGIAYQRLGAYDEAAALLEQAVVLGERASPPDEAELAEALHRLGMVYRTQGRAGEAESALQRAVDLSRQLGGPSSPELLTRTVTLAGLYISLGRYGDADPILQEVMEIQEDLLGPDHPDVANTLFTRGALHLSMRDAETAMPFLQRSLAIRESTLDPDHPLIARSLLNLSSGLILQKEYSQAEVMARRAAEIFEHTLGPDYLELGYAWHNLGKIRWAWTEYTEAEEYLLRAWRVKEAALGPDNITLATTYRVLGNVHRDQDRLDDAEPLYRDALAILDGSVDPGDPRILETLDDLATLLRMADRPDEAAEVEDRAAAPRAQAPPG